jgi:C-terminal processing protease CtpA/Prc
LTQQADFAFEARAYGNDVRVFEVKSKGPAAKGGLSVGDKILSLNKVPVNRDNIRQILRLIESVVPATSLDVEVLTPESKTQTVHMSARMILTQEHQYIESVWRVADEQRARDAHVNFTYKDYGDGINYVAIPSFRGDPDSTYSAIKKAEHSRALVLDLRGNRGGYLDALLAFLGFFSEHAQPLAKKIHRSQSEDLLIKPRYSGFNGSVVALVDSDSASAAELAARYLQLNSKARVFGDQTSGMVNEGHFIPGKIGAGFIMPFGVVVTDAKLVMLDGGELEGHGVVPDTVCIPNAVDLRQQHDPCLEQAIAVAKKWLLSKPQAN